MNASKLTVANCCWFIIPFAPSETRITEEKKWNFQFETISICTHFSTHFIWVSTMTFESYENTFSNNLFSIFFSSFLFSLLIFPHTFQSVPQWTEDVNVLYLKVMAVMSSQSSYQFVTKMGSDRRYLINWNYETKPHTHTHTADTTIYKKNTFWRKAAPGAGATPIEQTQWTTRVNEQKN